jgi:hypothetical protein
MAMVHEYEIAIQTETMITAKALANRHQSVLCSRVPS